MILSKNSAHEVYLNITVKHLYKNKLKIRSHLRSDEITDNMWLRFVRCGCMSHA